MRCPFCKSPRTVLLSARLWRCAVCDRHFDDDPDEGGDYSDNPTKRAERQEILEQRRRLRRVETAIATGEDLTGLRDRMDFEDAFR